MLIAFICQHGRLIAKTVSILYPSTYLCLLIIWVCSFSHQEKKSLFLNLLNLWMWPCDLLWSVECGRVDGVPVLSLGFRKIFYTSLSWNPATRLRTSQSWPPGGWEKMWKSQELPALATLDPKHARERSVKISRTAYTSQGWLCRMSPDKSRKTVQQTCRFVSKNKHLLLHTTEI